MSLTFEPEPTKEGEPPNPPVVRTFNFDPPVVLRERPNYEKDGAKIIAKWREFDIRWIVDLVRR